MQHIMKILVPIKRVPDYEQKIKISADADYIQTDAIKWILNPFDEIAVEEALRIKEAKAGSTGSPQGGNAEVVVVTIGPKECLSQIQTALAMGADRAIHVVSDVQFNFDLSYLILSELFKKDQYSLVIMGKQAIDSDSNQTAQLLAACLDLPQATFASKIIIEQDLSSATVTREVDGGLETIKITLPAVISTDLRLNTPRYATLPNIVKAKKKPVEELKISDFSVSNSGQVKLIKLMYPETRKAGVKVSSVAELVDKLKNEVKVI